MVYVPQKSKHGLVWEGGERNVIFYADNGRIVGRYHKWFQDVLSVVVEIFWRMALERNIDKSNTMVCTSGFIWMKWG